MKNIERILFLDIIFFFLGNACSPTNPYPETTLDNNPPEPTNVVVRILDLDFISKTLIPPELPTWTPVEIITEQVIPPPTQIPPTQTQPLVGTSISTATGCTNQVKLIRNLTINDNAVIEGGKSFTKIWRIENAGTCTWSSSYSLVFAGGETMGGSLSTPLSQEVKPGETFDLRLALIAPLYAQSYTGNWMFQDPTGIVFGVGENFDQPLSVIIVAKPPVTPIHT